MKGYWKLASFIRQGSEGSKEGWNHCVHALTHRRWQKWTIIILLFDSLILTQPFCPEHLYYLCPWSLVIVFNLFKRRLQQQPQSQQMRGELWVWRGERGQVYECRLAYTSQSDPNLAEPPFNIGSVASVWFRPSTRRGLSAVLHHSHDSDRQRVPDPH